jgi:hypothetical protein
MDVAEPLQMYSTNSIVSYRRVREIPCPVSVHT